MSRHPRPDAGTIRDTARLARPLWFGAITLGALIGGMTGLAAALHLTRPKES